MANFWQVLTAFGTGRAAHNAGKAAKEAGKLKDLQRKQNKLTMKEMKNSERRHQELMDIQREQLKFSAMTEEQKREYQEQKAREEDLNRRLGEYFPFDPQDPSVRKAIEISIKKKQFSTAMLQSYLWKGHAYVSELANWLESIGVIGPVNGTKPRDVLISSMDEFDALVEELTKKALK